MIRQEKRAFDAGAKVWVQRYENLRNLAHWHFEDELVVCQGGEVRLMLNGGFYDLAKGDCAFVSRESVHSIAGAPGSRAAVAQFGTLFDAPLRLQALEACVHYPAATPYVNFWSNYASDRLYLNPGEFTAVSTFVPQQRYTDHAADCIYGDLNQAFADTEWAQASGWSDNAYLKNLLNPTPPTEENTPETEEN